jgi:hypothetical protein
VVGITTAPAAADPQTAGDTEFTAQLLPVDTVVNVPAAGVVPPIGPAEGILVAVIAAKVWVWVHVFAAFVFAPKFCCWPIRTKATPSSKPNHKSLLISNLNPAFDPILSSEADADLLLIGNYPNLLIFALMFTAFVKLARYSLKNLPPVGDKSTRATKVVPFTAVIV